MALGYRKISDEEDQMRNVLEKGEYPFSVKNMSVKPTKSGKNKMLVVELEVLDLNGRPKTIKDWVVIDLEDMEWKLRHFAATCGLLDKYDNDTLEANDFLWKHGVVKLGIDDYEKDGDIRKINKVIDYVKPGQAKPVAQAEPDYEFNDDIPI